MPDKKIVELITMDDATLFDHFAACAAQGLCAKMGHTQGAEFIAETSYQVAVAMLRERDRYEERYVFKDKKGSDG